jgi:RNA polymerase sigma-70 factor (ECF subfamily)
LPEIELNEEKILSSASLGDREAFGELYELYVERIFNYVYYRTGNSHDAEDLTPAFSAGDEPHHQVSRPGVPFSAWLYQIAHNLVANWHRDRSHGEIPWATCP